MPSIGRAYVDSAGGKIITGAPSVQINNAPAARLGSLVQDHGRFEHDHAQMIVGFNGVEVENLPVCTTGMKASCGHPLISNSNVEAG